jgi:hypothetical protein
MSELLKDLEALLEKHKHPESSGRTLWVPICEHYKTAAYVGLHDDKGGATISRKAATTKVLWWVKLSIDPEACPVIQQIEAVKL